MIDILSLVDLLDCSSEMSAEKGRSTGKGSMSKSKSSADRNSRDNSQSPMKSKKIEASKTRSRTPKRHKHLKRSSRSRSPGNLESRSRRDSYDEKRSNKRNLNKRFRRSSSRSLSRGRRYGGRDRDNPKESRCVGIFGMSLHTDERTVRDIFERYGPLEDVQIVYDYHTGRSRGFAFVYYKYIEDAVEAKENAPGTEVDGHKIRVDFSITERAHTPTPGTYMGFKNNARSSGGRYHRSPSPRRKGGRYRSRSRSFSRDKRLSPSQKN